MVKGYIIENYEVRDKLKYIPPVKVINEILEKYQGKFLVATPKAETLHGKPLEVIVVLEFISKQKALDFYSSKDYASYKALYEQTTEGWVLSAEAYQK